MEAEDIFKGMTMKRFPFSHVCTSIEGFIPLHDTLAGFLFAMHHDKIPHTCLIKDYLDELKKERESIPSTCGNPDSATLATVFSLSSSSALAGMEFAYLSGEDVWPVYQMASSSIDIVSRFLEDGAHPMPFNPVCGFTMQQTNAKIRHSRNFPPHRDSIAYMLRFSKQIRSGIDLQTLFIGLALIIPDKDGSNFKDFAETQLESVRSRYGGHKANDIYFAYNDDPIQIRIQTNKKGHIRTINVTKEQVEDIKIRAKRTADFQCKTCARQFILDNVSDIYMKNGLFCGVCYGEMVAI